MVPGSRLLITRSFPRFFHSLGAASVSLVLAIGCGGGNSDGAAGASGSGADSETSGFGGSAGTPSSFTFGEPVTLADGQPVSIRIAQDDTSLYVTNNGDSGKGNGSLVKVAKSGGVLETLAESRETPMGLAYPNTIAVDERHLAWSFGARPPTIVIKDVANLSVVKQFDFVYDSISQLLLDAPRNQIIVVDRGDTWGKIEAVALFEDRRTRLTPALSTLQAAAIHGTRLFFTIPGDGQVASLDLNTQADLRANARGLNRPWGIAVDDEYFYVTERFSPADGPCT